MFIDYLTIMLLNLSAGLTILAIFVFKLKDFENWDLKKFVPGFAITGFIGMITGFFTIFTWPLPGSHNIAFGELSTLFGFLFLGAALALAKEWDLTTVTVYAVFAGAASILMGVRIINLEMTKEPLVSGIGFIFTGIAGVLSAPAYLLRKVRIIAIIGVIVLAVAVVVWVITGYGAYWDHMEAFAKWVPIHMR
jgi:putative membrane protein